MPHKRNPVVAERICGLARVVRANALVGLENVALWHERDISHSSAERVVIPDSFLALDYMLDRFAWLVEGLDRPARADARATSRRATGSSSASGCCSRSSSPGSPRDDAYRLVQRHALRAHEEEQDFRELVRADEEIAGRVDLDAIFDLGWYTRHVDTVFERLGALARKEEPFMSEAATHVGSGKVRELYELDDERLLLVASDRISTFDVVLPTEIPDKGRVLTGLSAFWFARTREHRPEPPARAARPTAARPSAGALEMLPIECVVRGYLTGSGWKDYQATGAVCGHGCPTGCASPTSCPSRSSRRRRRRTRATTRTSTASAPPSSSAQERFDEVERDLARALPLRRRARAPSAGSSSPTRSSSSGSTPTGGSCSATRSLTPDSSRFWPADEYEPGARAAVASTSSSCATTARRSAGTRRTPGPELPDDVVAGTRARYVEAFERLTGIAVRRLPRRPGGRARDEGDRARPAEAGHPRPAGRGRRELAPAPRLRGRRGARRARGRPRARRRDADEARAELERMCEQLLANPLIESYEIELRRRVTRAPRPRIAVVVFPGSNDDRDARARARAARRRRRCCVWHAERELPDVGAVVLPGRLLVRRLPALRRDRALLAGDGARSRAFAGDGGLVLGICNGFQVLCEAGLLPGRAAPERVALVRLPRRRRSRVERADTPFTSRCEPGQRADDPGQARRGLLLRRRRAARRARGERPDRAALRTARTRTARSPTSPASSTSDGNVFGLMPHPEHAVDPLLGSTDGALDPRLARRRRARARCSRRLGAASDAAERRRQRRALRRAPARSRSRSRARSVTGPRRAEPLGRVREAHEPLAAGRLEQLDDRREALLARALRERQLLDELRRAPGCRRLVAIADDRSRPRHVSRVW